MNKKLIMIITAIVLVTCVFSGCATWDRTVTDVKSEFNNGLDRTITVYTANGDIIAQYEGKIDIQESQGGYVKFDFEGKRYIYYNCFVETIADK